MVDGAAAFSLFDQIRILGFRASIISTYSCYLPFYEQVVLRRLVAAGCSHNVVFVDSGRLGEALRVEGLRPRLAGTAYTLIPVRRNGAFHPKLLLQVGPNKGALFVGSHNLTLSGFGLNDEISSVFKAEPPNPRSGGAPFHAVRDFLRSFLPADLPDVGDAFEAVFAGVPWMHGPVGAGGPPREVVATTGDAEDLWSHVRRAIPTSVTRVLIVSPFFDESLMFVRRLLAEVQPSSVTVAIDPTSTMIPRDAGTRLPGVQFVNISGRSLVQGRREGAVPYIHAKAIWFESAGGELLVIGSANASAPAFLEGARRRNAEALTLDSTPGVAEGLGLLSFFEAPELSVADWAQVQSAYVAEAEGERADVPVVLLGTPSEDGFTLSGTVSDDLALRAVDQDGVVLGDVSIVAGAQPARIVADAAIRSAAAFLLEPTSRPAIMVVIHRPDEIGRHSATDTRRTLKQALGALDDDPSQIDALLKITQKVIFDTDDNVVGAPVEPPRAAKGADASPRESEAAQTLGIEAQGRRTSRRRSLARGDLAYLLDALIRRLGEGIPPEPSSRPLEEEEIGADQEHGGDLASATIDFERLARTCRSKTKKLVKRMLISLEGATEPGQAHRAVVQLTAVEGVLRAIALVEKRPEWQRRGEQLIEDETLFALVEGAAIALLGRGEGLLAQARRETGVTFEELSSSLGLLGALMYLCGIDATSGPPRVELFDEPQDDREYWSEVQLFATLGPTLALDEDAQSTLTQSIERLVAGSRWLPDHLELASALADLETTPQAAARSDLVPKRGDWVIVPAGFNPRVRVILDVLPTIGGPKVVVADFSNESGERVFLAPRVGIVARASLSGEQDANRARTA